MIRQVPSDTTTGANTWTGTVMPLVTWQQNTGVQTDTNDISKLPSRAYILPLDGNTPKLSFSLNTWDRIRLLVAQPPVKAVVRVNQIIAPNGEPDGPFSSDTEYTAKQAGVYNFTFGVNQMASQDIYTGTVTVNVTLDLK